MNEVQIPETAKYLAYIINLLVAKLPQKVTYEPSQEDFLEATRVFYDTVSLAASAPEAIPLEDVPTRVPPIPKIKDKKVINRLFIVDKLLYRIFRIPINMTLSGLSSITYIPSPAFKRRMIIEAHKILNDLS